MINCMESFWCIKENLDGVVNFIIIKEKIFCSWQIVPLHVLSNDAWHSFFFGIRNTLLKQCGFKISNIIWNSSNAFLISATRFEVLGMRYNY